ncbi:activating transcription factor 3 [Agrilus planipennis]|uniref:Activating transcription factor 3 n=1 Tax=Agrilus planipennis TaxID=224129 RepID=A0A1W4WL40_AGRPL|nr:activating transcription factor 3 [Agrilus planipennis]XP_025831799.1 activating transcription factor 3 [Agrilus planipennis]
MYNLNVNLATSAANAVNNLLAVESACSTPRTPEILNSLIAMTNPLDNYTFDDDSQKNGSNVLSISASNDSNSSSSSTMESPTATHPSIQHTCSQLIKAGLKLSIEQKRKINGDSDDLLDLDSCKRIKKCESESEDGRNPNGLTPEDEERRRRRRERNKIAATKCRLKKRERTANLIRESETLETQNIELKSQVQEMQNQQRLLIDMISKHRSVCTENIPTSNRDPLCTRLPPMSSISTPVIESNHSYCRQPNNANMQNIFKTENLDIFNGALDVSEDISYRRNSLQFNKAPSIIIEAAVDSYDQTQLLDLDNSDHCISNYNYNHQQCHNYSSDNYGSTGMDSGCMA